MARFTRDVTIPHDDRHTSVFVDIPITGINPVVMFESNSNRSWLNIVALPADDLWELNGSVITVEVRLSQLMFQKERGGGFGYDLNVKVVVETEDRD